jgi:glycosyltransferase involved in cell wall biosynthesis
VRRVLFLIKALGWGGAQRLLVEAAQHLDTARTEYEVAFLVSELDDLAGDLERAGLRVHDLGGTRGGLWIPRLRRLVARRSIRVVHAHSPYAAAGARLGLVGVRPRVALVYTEHNVWPSYRAPTRWANAATFSRNEHVFAVSEEVRRSIRRPWPLRLPPVETLYHGIDQHGEPTGGTALRAELGIPAEAPVVGTVGEFRPEKGHRYLLEAAAHLRRTQPDVRFVLVGSGPLEGDLRDRAGRLGLGDRVLFAGHRRGAAGLADAFDVFALPSVHEGLPIALLEAMAASRPAVVTAAGGTTEVVRDGDSACVVPPSDAGALAEALERVLGDPALRARLGRNARARAAEFDIRVAVGRMESVYDGLLA